MRLLYSEPTSEGAILAWSLGWLSSFPVLVLAENELSWMIGASISLSLMVAGLRQARAVARRREKLLTKFRE